MKAPDIFPVLARCLYFARYHALAVRLHTRARHEVASFPKEPTPTHLASRSHTLSDSSMYAMRALVAAAISSLLAATATSAASCDLVKIFSSIQPFQSSADVKACVAATGYEMLPPVDPPTDAQLAKFCASGPCTSILTALQKMDLPDCPIDMLGGVNIKQVFAVISAKCSSSGGTPTVSPSPAPASTPTVTTTAPQTPAAATPAPAATSGSKGVPAKAISEPTLEPQMCE